MRGSGDSLIALAVVFAPLSLLSFGGVNAVIADIAQQAIAVQGWTSEREFADLFALSRAAPGPGSMLATLIGWKVAGIAGALVATLAYYLPSALLVFVGAQPSVQTLPNDAAEFQVKAQALVTKLDACRS